MRNPTLLTVILNYRTPKLALKAAKAALEAMNGVNGEIIIVDNASGDESFGLIQKGISERGWDKDNRVRALLSPSNGGFGAGNNLGIREGISDGSTPDYIYILNPDAFPDPDAICNLLDHLQSNPDVGFAGSCIYGEDGEPHLTAFRFPSIASEFEGAARLGPISRLLSKYRVPLAMPQTTRKVDWLAGASLMMRTKTLEEIGLFDETFFLYFEETDLCLRAAKAGWSTDYVVESKVMHIGSVSTGMKDWNRVPEYWLDSRLHYFRKNFGSVYAFGATLANVTGLVISRSREFLQRKPSGAPQFFLRDLIWHGLKSAAGLNRRRQTCSNNTATPKPSIPNAALSDRRNS